MNLMRIAEINLKIDEEDEGVAFEALVTAILRMFRSPGLQLRPDDFVGMTDLEKRAWDHALMQFEADRISEAALVAGNPAAYREAIGVIDPDAAKKMADREALASAAAAHGMSPVANADSPMGRALLSRYIDDGAAE